MHTIEISHPTPKQLRKLISGERVRIKKGTGFNLVVHPATYNIVAKAFNRERGAEIGLSPEELNAMNMISGVQRIQQYDTSGNPILPEAPIVTPQQIQQRPPAPDRHINPHGMGLRQHIGTSGVRNLHKVNDMASQIGQVKHFDEMNKQLGTNFDYLGRAGYDKAASNKLTASFIEDSINARHKKASPSYSTESPISRGSGLRQDRTVMGQGVRLSESVHNTQALQSQPLNENFQMNHFLPPQFQLHKEIHGGAIIKGFSEDAPPAFTSKNDESDFKMRQHLNPSQRAGGVGLYSGGTGGSGLYASGRAGRGLGP